MRWLDRSHQPRDHRHEGEMKVMRTTDEIKEAEGVVFWSVFTVKPYSPIFCRTRRKSNALKETLFVLVTSQNLFSFFNPPIAVCMTEAGLIMCLYFGMQKQISSLGRFHDGLFPITRYFETLKNWLAWNLHFSGMIYCFNLIQVLSQHVAPMEKMLF